MGVDWQKKVRGGTNMFGMPARAYNKFIDAAIAHENRDVATPTTKPGGIPFQQSNPDTIEIRNESIGGVLELGEVVGLGDPIITPTNNEVEYRQTLVFDVVVPDEDDNATNWGIVVDPVAGSNKHGEVQVSGYARCIVDMQDAAHKYATFGTSTTEYMVSTDDTTKAPIVWVEDTSGQQEAVVYVRPFGSTIAGGFTRTDINSNEVIGATGVTNDAWTSAHIYTLTALEQTDFNLAVGDGVTAYKPDDTYYNILFTSTGTTINGHLRIRLIGTVAEVADQTMGYLYGSGSTAQRTGGTSINSSTGSRVDAIGITPFYGFVTAEGALTGLDFQYYSEGATGISQVSIKNSTIVVAQDAENYPA